MFHHHLPGFISRLALLVRPATDFFHQGLRVIGIGAARVRARSGKASSPTGRPFFRSTRVRPPLLVHYHIFKNAGTSFEWALEQALGSAYASFDTPSPRGFVSARDLAHFVRSHPAVRAVASHQAAPPPPRLRERKMFTSILIRDPLARVKSIYAFERAQVGHSPGAQKAKELDFRGYVEWRLKTSPATLCNYQVHFCTRTAKSRSRKASREQLEQAIANLDTISIVGTVARYDDWLALAQKVLEDSFPGMVLQTTRQNATGHSKSSQTSILETLIDELGESITQHLLANNELDMCLHQIADSILTRKMAEENIELNLVRAYAEAERGFGSAHKSVSS